ncbi:MAG: transposase [Porticoccaceae bacterium]|jgi:transposase
MEACGGANYWARVFQRSGHSVKLISPQLVKPFVKTNKNDANDALANNTSRIIWSMLNTGEEFTYRVRATAG